MLWRCRTLARFFVKRADTGTTGPRRTCGPWALFCTRCWRATFRSRRSSSRAPASPSSARGRACRPRRRLSSGTARETRRTRWTSIGEPLPFSLDFSLTAGPSLLLLDKSWCLLSLLAAPRKLLLEIVRSLAIRTKRFRHRRPLLLLSFSLTQVTQVTSLPMIPAARLCPTAWTTPRGFSRSTSALPLDPCCPGCSTPTLPAGFPSGRRDFWEISRKFLGGSEPRLCGGVVDRDDKAGSVAFCIPLVFASSELG